MTRGRGSSGPAGAGNVRAMPVVEADHQRAMRAVDRRAGRGRRSRRRASRFRAVWLDHQRHRRARADGPGSSSRRAKRSSRGFSCCPMPGLILAPYLLALRGRRARGARGRTKSYPDRASASCCLAGALLRATLLLRAPDLSDDVCRYLWDGRVAASASRPTRSRRTIRRCRGLAPELAGRVAHRDVAERLSARRARRFFASRSARRGRSSCGSVLFGRGRSLRRGARLRPPRDAGRVRGGALRLSSAAGDRERGAGTLDSLGVALLLACSSIARPRPARSVGHRFRAVGPGQVRLARGGDPPAAAAGRVGFWQRPRSPCGRRSGSPRRGRAPRPSGGLAHYATRWDFNSVLYTGAVAASRGSRSAANGRRRRFWRGRSASGIPPGRSVSSRTSIRPSSRGPCSASLWRSVSS